MFRSRWMRNLLDVTHSRKDRRRLIARNRKTVRPVLESLEERLTPSGGNATVTQTAGGYTALTGLVKSDTAANTNYNILITNSFTFNSGGQVTISKLGAGSTMTIQGQNGQNFTLTGNLNRLFDVAGKTQNLTLKNLTLTGGSGVSQGGAVMDQGGSVTLSSMTVTKNSVTTLVSNAPKGTAPKTQGGGVFVSGNGNLNLNNTTIKGNQAFVPGVSSAPLNVAEAAAEGGGVSISGASTVNIKGGSITGNSAVGGTGRTLSGQGITGASGKGGGLFVYGPSKVIISGTTISNNSAIGGSGGNSTATPRGGGGVPGGFGGSGEGGALYLSDAGWSLSLSGTTLSGNTAQGGDGGDGAAGEAGIAGTAGAAGAGGTNGTAGSPDGGPGGTGGDGTPGAPGGIGGSGGFGGHGEGGGVFLSGGGTATMAGVTFSTNQAIGGTGGTGGAGGKGGVGGAGGAGGAGGTGFTSAAAGGAGGPGFAGAPGGAGGAGGGGGQGGNGLGGGVFVNGSTILTITESSTAISTFLSNTAKGGGGGVGGIGGTGGTAGAGGAGGIGGKGGASGPAGVPGNGGKGGTNVNASKSKTFGFGGAGGAGGASGAGGGGGLYVVATPEITSSILISGDNLQKNVAASGTGGTGGAGGLGGNGGTGGAAGGKTATSGVGGNGGFGGAGGGGGIAASARGGAIDTNVLITILNSSLIQNSVLGGTGGTGGAAGNGGGGGVGHTSSFSLNSGLGGNGGNGGNGATATPGGGGGTANGGGVFLSGTDRQHLVINTTFGQNSATAGSAGLGGQKGLGGANANGVIGFFGPKGATGLNGSIGTPGMGFGGATFVTFPATSVTPNTSFVNDTFAWNSATTEGGGVFITAISPPPVPPTSPPPPPPPPTAPPESANPPLFVNDILQNNQALSGPDFFVTMPDKNINANNSNDFVGLGGINGWFIGSGSLPLAGTIVNNNTPQLENTLSTVTSPSGLVSPYFYRPLPGSLVVNAGTATALNTIATAEIAAGELLPGAPASDALDETLVNPRSLNSGSVIDMGAVQFSVPNSTLNIAFLPRPGVTVPFGTNSVGVEVLVSQGANEGNLPVNGGTVTFNLEQGKSVIGTYTANVSSIGIASASIALPILLPPGSYTITASYANGNAGPANPQGTFSATATTTLTIGPAPTPPPAPPSPPPPIPVPVAALEAAIDLAALLLQGNPAGLFEVRAYATLLGQFSVPTTVPGLIQDFNFLYPQSGNLGLAAIQFGLQLAQMLE